MNDAFPASPHSGRTSAQLSQEAAATRLLEYRKQIESGAKSFEDLARQFSDDGSAPQGGDLGWAERSAFVGPFSDALFSMKQDEIRGPVKSEQEKTLIANLAQRTGNVKRVDNQLEIAVKDDGPGLASTANLFVPFFTTKSVGKGTGLGLSISQRIIENHGGLIEVRNRPTGGAQFTVVLPVN